MKLIDDFQNVILTCLFLSLVPLAFVDTFNVRESYFAISPICNNQENYENRCVTFAGMARTPIDCASICNSNHTCIGASVGPHNECFLHIKCHVSNTCDLVDTRFTHLVKSPILTECLHGGKWDFKNKRCVCKGGWVGKSCDVRAQTCEDLREDGYGKGYHYVTLEININGTEFINLYCIISKKSSDALILANNGSGDFNRSWEQYLTGFGNTYYNTWLGLRNIYLLNRAGYKKLSVDLTFGTNKHARREYSGFLLMNSSQNYRLTHGSSKGVKRADLSLRSCITPLQNTDFSTWDMDNDADAEKNCASLNGAGWWYKDCNVECNLLAFRNSSGNYSVGIWKMPHQVSNLKMLLRRE